MGRDAMPRRMTTDEASRYERELHLRTGGCRYWYGGMTGPYGYFAQRRSCAMGHRTAHLYVGPSGRDSGCAPGLRWAAHVQDGRERLMRLVGCARTEGAAKAAAMREWRRMALTD